MIVLMTNIPRNTTGQPLLKDSVSMSAGYINEVYYSMPNGTSGTSLRSTWDIAFRTDQMSSSILTNDGAGVVLWSYPSADTAGWATVDTAGLFAWTPMYNDPADWENGAFSRFASGHPDYGWGVYNMATHNVVGDSLFIIKLRDGSFRKLAIVQKNSIANVYTLKVANLDGSDESVLDMDLSTTPDPDFTGLSLTDLQPVDFQPAEADWDILFTKYMSVQPNGEPYSVTGVLSNPNVKVKRFAEVPVSYSDWWVGDWDSTRSPIGWDWKVFNMETFSYEVVDSLVFFVLIPNTDIYKLVFTKFEGTSTGNIGFDYGKVSSLGIGGNGNRISLTAYPNPASDEVHLFFSSSLSGDAEIRLTDLAGRVVRRQMAAVAAGNLEETVISVAGLTPGVYVAVITNGAEKAIQKIIVSK